MRKVLSTKKIDPSLRSFVAGRQIEVVETEMIRISLGTDDHTRELVNLLTDVVVVFTSKNAVKGLLKMVPDGAHLFNTWKIYCTGGPTRELIKTQMGSDVAASASNAEELSRLIIENEKNGEIVFFCGSKRRDELPDALQQAGIAVKEIQVYETLLTPVRIEEQYDAILFFSPSAVQSFFSVNETNSDTIVFSIGSTTTAELMKHTSNKIITSSIPSEAAVFQSMAAAW